MGGKWGQGAWRARDAQNGRENHRGPWDIGRGCPCLDPRWTRDFG